jgi:hypothetical protein
MFISSSPFLSVRSSGVSNFHEKMPLQAKTSVALPAQLPALLQQDTISFKGHASPIVPLGGIEALPSEPPEFVRPPRIRKKPDISVKAIRSILIPDLIHKLKLHNKKDWLKLVGNDTFQQLEALSLITVNKDSLVIYNPSLWTLDLCSRPGKKSLAKAVRSTEEKKAARKIMDKKRWGREKVLKHLHLILDSENKKMEMEQKVKKNLAISSLLN